MPVIFDLNFRNHLCGVSTSCSMAGNDLSAPENLRATELPSQPEVMEDGLLVSASQIRLVKTACIAIVVFMGLLQAWIGAYFFNPDGICYVDVGRAFTSHHWLDAFNSYWSPLYAWTLGIALQIFGRSAESELPIVHAVNFAIYLFAFCCFSYFLRVALSTLRPSETTSGSLQHLPEFALWIAANGIFLWTTLTQISVWDVSPDVLVAAMVYLIAATILQIRKTGSLALFIKLGVLFGISYWCKAVMFPLSFLFAFIACVAAPQRQKRYVKTAVALLLFVIVSAPLATMLSMKEGRFTFGNSGWLNYSSYVSPGGRVRNWQGQPASSGIPLHATRKIFANPDIFEFAQPIAGTYPPSDDPPYWNAGRKWTFSVRAQAAAILRHFILYTNLFLLAQAGILVGVLALLFCDGNLKKILMTNWPLLAMAGAALGTYALVHVENRFLGAYVVLLWIALLWAVELPSSTARNKLAHYLLIAMAASCLLSTAGDAYRIRRDSADYSAAPHLEVASQLEAAGVHPEDQIAVIGKANWAYYAQFARVKIIAEIMDEDTSAFWTSSPAVRNEIYTAFAGTGASALVTRPPLPLPPLDPGWIKLGDTPYYMRWLQRTHALSATQ
jgi:hypothetical protein